ncbi:Complement factor B [Anabarilius grahami]|uniref:C3/C5 convertase n=1 Tax=Anabarilius grahami TaxID=495550 RepID=A0A3N0YVF9_ANAGA|nr:Complement factor B [Anabarilius grahami]
MENISCFSMAARALRIGSYGFINKAQFYAGFTDRLKLRDGAVTAIKDPGHESEPQVLADDRYTKAARARHSLAPLTRHASRRSAVFRKTRHGSCPKENLNMARGSFVLSKGYSDGSFLKYICPYGYYPSVQSRRCQYGLWTPKTSTRKSPECKKVTCPNPRVLENGQVTPYKERYYVNDTTTYSCHSDYKFRGSAVRVCKLNGKWSGSTPICGRDSDHCPDPGVPPGSSRTGHMFHIGDKVTYRCDSSLTLIGSKERVCQDGGQWSGTEPQCYADFTYDIPWEASEALSSALKSNIAVSQQYEEDQPEKKITLDQGGKLDIYIAVDASDSIDEEDFNKAKNIIKMLIEQPAYDDILASWELIKCVKESKLWRESLRLTHTSDLLYRDARLMSVVGKLATMTRKTDMREEFVLFRVFLFLVRLHVFGQANMGGNPIPKVNQIKHLVTKNDPKREKKLDLYVFGVGDDVNKEDINGMVSERDQEKHFFKLSDLDEVQKPFDSMIDESTSVGLCGIHQDYDEDNKRSAFPWLVQINVARPPQGSNCMGSLVTSSYILTAAHCFKEGDTPDRISVTLEKGLAVKVEKYILHPDYNITAKQHMGIKEYYEFDVALIQLKKAVTMSVNLRPICVPCTRETNGALKLSDSDGTCKKHGERDACVEDAKKAEGINVINAKDVVTDNVLCSGGTEPKTDDVACKGEAGGATYVNKKDRLIQVGVVSWGVKDLCTKGKPDPLSQADTRDYHTNLFSEKIQSFLKEHLGNDNIGHPLSFF